MPGDPDSATAIKTYVHNTDEVGSPNFVARLAANEIQREQLRGWEDLIF